MSTIRDLNGIKTHLIINPNFFVQNLQMAILNAQKLD